MAYAVTFDDKMRCYPVVRPADELVKQIIVQLLSPKCRYGLGLNDQRMMSFSNVNSRIAVGNVINMSATYGKSNLPGSPLGPFTGAFSRLEHTRACGSRPQRIIEASVAQATGQGGQAGRRDMHQGSEELDGDLGTEGGHGNQHLSQQT